MYDNSQNNKFTNLYKNVLLILEIIINLPKVKFKKHLKNCEFDLNFLFCELQLNLYVSSKYEQCSLINFSFTLMITVPMINRRFSKGKGYK